MDELAEGEAPLDLVGDREECREVEVLDDVSRGALAHDGLVEQSALGRVSEIEPVVCVGPVEAKRELDNTDHRTARRVPRRGRDGRPGAARRPLVVGLGAHVGKRIGPAV